MDSRSKDYERVKEWASALLIEPFVVLDSETTGLDSDAEIVQLAILDSSGETLFNSLIKCDHPEKLLEKGRGGMCAADIHGIHPDDLEDAPTWADIADQVFELLDGRRVIIYNASYDWPLLRAAFERMDKHCPEPQSIECAMERYAVWVGDWNDYHGNYRWQKLPGGDHSALGDAKATKAIIAQMAGLMESEPPADEEAPF